jgi:hypothetical protein
MSTGTGLMDGIAPDNLTHTNVIDGTIKYKNLKKNKLQLLSGNLLGHIKDLKVEKAKVKLRLEEELKESKVEKAKVKLRLEEELKEDVFFVDDNGTGATSSGEDNVKGVEEGDVNINVNATSSEAKLASLAKSTKLAKSAELAKLVKLAKSTDLWCLSPHVPLEAKDKQKQRKVCPVSLRV